LGPPAIERPVLRPASLVEGIGQALSIKVNNLVYELRSAGRDVITMSLGEAFFALPDLALESLVAGDAIHHYSHSRGLPQLRARVARYCQDDLRVPVDPASEIIVTAGSKAAIYMSLLAVLEPGDEVIIPEPFWLSYPEQVSMCRGRPVMVPHDESVFDIVRYLSPRTRAIIINNPNNPSGKLYTEGELRFLHELAREQNVLLIADEAYNEFVPPTTTFMSCGELDPDKHHTVIVNSMSKNFGISGWRVGYVVAHRSLTDQILKINQHLVTCAPTILQWYLAEHFDDVLEVTRPQIRNVVALRNRAAGWLAEAGIDMMPGTATFYLFASLGRSRLTSTEFTTRLLRDSGVSVVAGIGYGASCDRYIRISIGAEPEDRIYRGFDAVRRLIEETQP